MNLKNFSLPSLDKSEKREILKTAIILCLIVGITAFLIAVVNELTYRRIDENQARKISNAMHEVIVADSYELLDTSGYEMPGVLSVYEAKDADNSVVGYCVQSHARGFDSEISLVVGVDKDGSVTKVCITDMSETPGVGTKTKSEGFLSRFEKKSGILSVTRGDAKKETDISALSGATVSSKAVTEGVNAALAAVLQVISNNTGEVAEA